MEFNRFSTNFPHMDKPGSWFLLAKCIFKHFARKTNYLVCYVSGTLVDKWSLTGLICSN